VNGYAHGKPTDGIGGTDPGQGPPPSNDAVDKRSLRTKCRQHRKALSDRPARSRAIWDRVFTLPEYRVAATVMCYVDHRDEVETRPYFDRIWRDGKRLVVPYCADRSGGEQPRSAKRSERRLGLFLLETINELEPGTLGILEPPQTLRDRTDRRVEPASLGLVLAPGLAFDRRGRRLGQGGGYYDRLLADLPASTPVVALAFECQVIDHVPTAAHDIPVHKVVTESTVHGQGSWGVCEAKREEA